MTLTARDEDRLRGFPADYRDKAIRAVEGGRAFCPSCHFAGHSNCAHFDECDAFIEPDKWHRELIDREPDHGQYAKGGNASTLSSTSRNTAAE